MERSGHNIGMRKPEPLQIGLNTTIANDELHPWAFAQSLPRQTLVGSPAESKEELHFSKNKKYIELNIYVLVP